MLYLFAAPVMIRSLARLLHQTVNMCEESSKWTLLYQGAESKLWKGDYMGISAVKKERFSKKYRHPELDDRLTKDRQKYEVRALRRIQEKSKLLGQFVPKVLHEGERELILSFVDNSQPVFDYLQEYSKSEGKVKDPQFSQLSWLFHAIGKSIAEVHRVSLVHGDLTTSNLLLLHNEKDFVVPIDFGLTASSESPEDRAVDLYVLERAMSSSHTGTEKGFQTLLDTYISSIGPNAGPKVQKKLDEVRLRGRKRSMVG